MQANNTKKKGLTWNEVLALPLETPVRLSWWEEGYIYRERWKDNKHINFYDKDGVRFHIEIDHILQDQWEIYEKPKPEKKYMTGLEALELLYKGKKIALDDEVWLQDFGFIMLMEVCPNSWHGSLNDALSEDYVVHENKWYVVE
jgi:hypothetical protein